MEHVRDTKNTIGQLCANSFWMDDRKQGEETQIKEEMLYGKEPKYLGTINIPHTEMYFYQYLPIKLMGQGEYTIPDQLKHLEELVRVCMINFAFDYPDRDLMLQNIYLSAKHLFAPTGSNINRPGWHCDGFMSDDINYIWSDSLPTEWAKPAILIELPQDHDECLNRLKEIENDNFFEINECKPNGIYKLDETVIHRPKVNTAEPFLRSFVKISFSEERYNLKGNSHNYLLDYNWEMKERSLKRNHPIK